MKTEKAGMNPYWAGALAGALAVFSVLMTGKFFGASTTFVRAAGMIEKVFVPERVAGMAYYVKEAPKVEWQWMFLIGIALGSFVAALVTRSFAVSFVPGLWRERFGPGWGKRLCVAFIGGVIVICGARLADGCPSGHGLSGVMQLAVSGFVALVCFFIGGIIVARSVYAKRRAR